MSKKAWKPKHERRQHISARIEYEDAVKLTDHPRRNISKVIRDFVQWTLKDRDRRRELYDEGRSVTDVIASSSMSSLESTLRKVIQEENSKESAK